MLWHSQALEVPKKGKDIKHGNLHDGTTKWLEYNWKASERHDFFEWKVNKRKTTVSSAAGDVQNGKWKEGQKKNKRDWNK